MKQRRIFSRGHSVRASLLIFTLATFAILLHGCSLPGPSGGESVSDGSPVGGFIPIELHIDDNISEENIDEIRTKYPGWELITRLDAFVFDASGGMILESYNRLHYHHQESLTLTSGTGEKVIAFVANHDFKDSEIERIYCMDDLESMFSELTEEDVSSPVMTGKASYMVGNGGRCDLTLSPMMSVIEIRSLRCRMSDVDMAALEDVKVYLTGVNNRCGLFETRGFNPTDILNGNGISESDLRRFKNQPCLYSYRKNGKKLSDGSVEYGPVSLYCYPSDAAVESMGSPFTRLIIEGKSAGRNCHYEFAINRGEDCGGEDSAGISRNCRYVYEIMLTRPSQ